MTWRLSGSEVVFEFVLKQTSVTQNTLFSDVKRTKSSEVCIDIKIGQLQPRFYSKARSLNRTSLIELGTELNAGGLGRIFGPFFSCS